jgi:hypothetical protein
MTVGHDRAPASMGVRSLVEDQIEFAMPETEHDIAAAELELRRHWLIPGKKYPALQRQDRIKRMYLSCVVSLMRN